MANFIRRLVSQHKKRFQDEQFDLDLTYITERVLGMAWPGDGAEGLYRNPISAVNQMLNKYHYGHYKVYNLCSERSYNPSKFSGGEYAAYPYEDHQVPHLQVLLDFVRDAAAYLAADEKNVVVVHCKAGKGRTGTCVASLLLWLGVARTWSAALAMYASKRTINGKGVTISSQRRWVQYFEAIMPLNHVPEPPSIVLTSLQIRGLPPKVSSKLVIVLQQREHCEDGRYYMRTVLVARMPAAPSAAGYAFDVFLCGGGGKKQAPAAALPAPQPEGEKVAAQHVHHGQSWSMEISPSTCVLRLKENEKKQPWTVKGDFKVSVYLGSISKSRMAFWTWHNSTFMTGNSCTLPVDSLDKVHSSLPKSVELSMHWNVGVGGMLHTRAASAQDMCRLPQPVRRRMLDSTTDGLCKLDSLDQVFPSDRRARTDSGVCLSSSAPSAMPRSASCLMDSLPNQKPYLQLIDDIDSLWMGATQPPGTQPSDAHVSIKFPDTLLHKSSAFRNPVSPRAISNPGGMSAPSAPSGPGTPTGNSYSRHNPTSFASCQDPGPSPCAPGFCHGASTPNLQTYRRSNSGGGVSAPSRVRRDCVSSVSCTPPSSMLSSARPSRSLPTATSLRHVPSCSTTSASSPPSDTVVLDAPAAHCGGAAAAAQPLPRSRTSLDFFRRAPVARPASARARTPPPRRSTSCNPPGRASASGIRPPPPTRLASMRSSPAASRTSDPGHRGLFGNFRHIIHTPWHAATRRATTPRSNPFNGMPFDMSHAAPGDAPACAAASQAARRRSRSLPRERLSSFSAPSDDDALRPPLTREMTLSLLGWGPIEAADGVASKHAQSGAADASQHVQSGLDMRFPLTPIAANAMTHGRGAMPSSGASRIVAL